MAIKNWSGISQKYAGKWIAFGKDNETVVSSANSLKTALSRAEKQGFVHPLVFKVPIKAQPYIG